jgi:hypothetical protein
MLESALRGHCAKPVPNTTSNPTAKIKRMIAGIIDPFGVQASAVNPSA